MPTQRVLRVKIEAAIINEAAPFTVRCHPAKLSIKMTEARYFALIPAAGIGARMGAGCPKQYLPIAGKPMLRHTVDAFRADPAIAHTFVVVSDGDAYIDEVLPPDLSGVTVLRCGGATRRDSVLNGLRAIQVPVASH